MEPTEPDPSPSPDDQPEVVIPGPDERQADIPGPDERQADIPGPDERQAITSGPDDERHAMSPVSMALAAVAAVAVAIVLVVAFTGGSDEVALGPDGELASFGFLSTDGSTSTLAEYRGDPLVVNFFASWCAPCRAELPDLEQVHLARQGEVEFLGINHDLDETTWRSFVDETDITYDTVFQPDTEIFTALDAKGMPTTVLLSGDGEVLHMHTGLLTDDLLNELLDEHFGGA